MTCSSAWPCRFTAGKRMTKQIIIQTIFVIFWTSNICCLGGWNHSIKDSKKCDGPTKTHLERVNRKQRKQMRLKKCMALQVQLLTPAQIRCAQFLPQVLLSYLYYQPAQKWKRKPFCMSIPLADQDQLCDVPTLGPPNGTCSFCNYTFWNNTRDGHGQQTWTVPLWEMAVKLPGIICAHLQTNES